MTVYFNNEGSMIISDIVGGYLFERVYQGYTKREALARFKRAVKEEKNSKSVRMFKAIF